MSLSYGKISAPRSAIVSVVVITLIVSLFLQLVLAVIYVNKERRKFNRQIVNVFETLSKGLKDNDSLLNSLEVLHKTSIDSNQVQINNYMQHLLKRHPQIVAVNSSEWTKNDGSANLVSGTELALPKRSGKRKRGRPAAPGSRFNRNFLYTKAFKSRAIEAITSKKLVIMGPADYQGRRVYLLIKAVGRRFADSRKKDGAANIKVIALVIDVNVLMSSIKQLHKNDYGFELSLGDKRFFAKPVKPDDNGLLGKIFDPLFPDLSFYGQFASGSQPFSLRVIKYNSVKILNTAVMAVTFFVCLLFGASALYIINMRHRARTVRQSAREALFMEREKAEVTFDSIEDAVVVTDLNSRIDYMNPVAEELTGTSLKEAKGELFGSVASFVNQQGEKIDLNPARLCRDDSKTVQIPKNVYIVTKKKKALISGSVSPLRNYREHPEGLVMVFRDVSVATDLAAQLKYQATHDDLTGLYNRREFTRRLKYAIEYATLPLVKYVLLYMDLDQFKIVNDTCGHIAGDQLLRKIAALLQSQLRGSDTLARLGGDEFAILLEDCDIRAATEIADKLNDVVKKFHFSWNRKLFDVAVSIGIVEIVPGKQTVSEALSMADTACYVAKEQGRNRYHIYKPDDDMLIQRRGEMEWVQRIKQAYEDERFELYIQAIVPLRAGGQGRPRHFEVLLRMIGEDDKVILPMSYILAAERYDKMYELDRWVIENAFAMIDRYRQTPGGMDFSFAINLSGQSLGDSSSEDFVLAQLEKYPRVSGHVIFEITETAAISNLVQANRFVSVFSKRGCRFSLDDFGSGLSSFAYLKNLPVDYLKIDGQFIKGLAKDQVDHALVNSINQIGHVMGIKTIAEYVESETIRDKLVEIGVDYGQGMFLDRPVSMRGFLFGDKAVAKRKHQK